MVRLYRPESLKEALQMTSSNRCTIFAGGTDLMVKRRDLPQSETDILFISHLKELRGIKKIDDYLCIGAACTCRELAEHRKIPALMRNAFSMMASPGVRNFATIGGNICNSSPAGDSLPILYAFDADIILESKGGMRKLPIEQFISGPGKNVIRQDEILTTIVVPVKKFDIKTYKKVGTRKSTALSKLSFTGLAEMTGGSVSDIRLAFGAVGPTVVRSRNAEDMIIKMIREGRFDKGEVRELYSSLIKPIDDQRSTAFYRKEVCLRLLEDFIFNKVMKRM